MVLDKDFTADLLLTLSIAVFGVFWLWAMVHAWRTPKADTSQRLVWVGAILVNPIAAVWYWYVWKRWAFWTLFSPLLGFFVSLPFVASSVLSKTDASNLTYTLVALGTSHTVEIAAALMIFPLILRLAALLHIGRNDELDAMKRNDWVVSLALPIFGFGAGMAYCARERRAWALAGLVWFVALSATTWVLAPNVAQALIRAGELRREQLHVAART
ncbi:MAG: hypothetical protein WA001_02780 [Patescibacteria group bacterium]